MASREDDDGRLGKSESESDSSIRRSEDSSSKKAKNPESVAEEFAPEWQRMRSRLRGELGDPAFNAWFKYLRVVSLKKGRLVIEVPTRFVRDWIDANYRRRLLEHWSAENPKVKRIEVRVQEDWQPPPKQEITRREQKVMPAKALGRRVGVPPEVKSAQNTGASNYESAGAPLDPRLTFASFVVGSSNQLAYAAAKRLAEVEVAALSQDGYDEGNPLKPTKIEKSRKSTKSGDKINPLFIYGGVGLGKTHLMHAVAWEILRAKPDARVLYLSAERFMYQFVRALRFKDTIAFKQQFRELDVLMVDDIQFISNKESTQEEFLHTFNSLLGENAQVIISADRAPQELEGLDMRLRSRLTGGMAADIRATDYELRLNILSAKAADIFARATHNKSGLSSEVPRPVLEFLATNITHNVRELEGALNRVVAYASFIGKPIDMEMTKDVLRDLLRAAERRVSIDEIQRQVADYYKIRIADLVSERRTRVVARPRQIAMYLAKELTPRSFPEIGRKFGGRDHSTVIHAVRRIKELREMDATLDEEVDLLAKMLGN